MASDREERHIEYADENEPLVGYDSVGEGGRVAALEDNQGSRSSWELFVSALGVGGLQIIWSLQHANGTPYLLSLGMSKVWLAFVWIAGPLTGVLVQPYIGVLSDNFRSRWGKRKPFMATGAAVTVICLLAVAWVREIVAGVLGIFGVDRESDAVRTVSILLATFLMYAVDFGVNTAQAAVRAFIVDNAPSHQQASANAWASRLGGAGNIVGYIFGYLDLAKTLAFLGNSQFQILCAVASVSLSVTIFVSCVCVKRDPQQEKPPAGNRHSLMSSLRLIVTSLGDLSPRIRKVLVIQLATWFAWFSFLFYATTYIGQLYVNPIFDEHRHLSDDEINRTWDEGTRIGTFALLTNAIVCFVAIIVLPMLVAPLGKQHDATSQTTESDSQPIFRLVRTIHPKLCLPRITIRRMWLSSHFLFAVCMFSTFLISSTQAASTMTGILGISTAITTWAPFAIISAEVAKLDAERRTARELSDNESQCEAGGIQNEAESQAGTVLGLHNVAISFPQMVASLTSGLIFKMLQKSRGEPWDESVAWVLRVGGVSALVAGGLTMGLEERR